MDDDYPAVVVVGGASEGEAAVMMAAVVDVASPIGTKRCLAFASTMPRTSSRFSGNISKFAPSTADPAYPATFLTTMCRGIRS